MFYPPARRLDRFFKGAVRTDALLDRLDHAVLAKAFQGEHQMVLLML